VGNCAGESRKIDEVQYKNHRTAPVSNETLQNHAMLHKTYPVYPAQVYANLSNVRDFGASNLNPGQQLPPSTTEMPTDVVRVFFTSAPVGKRKPLQDAGTTFVPSLTTLATGSVYRTVTPSTYIVTAKNVAVSADTKDPSHKSPIYSVPRSEAEVKYATSTVDFRDAPKVTAEQSRTKTKFNGTKIRRILKAQNQTPQSSLLSTVTTTPQMPPQFTNNQRNSTAFVVNAKTNATAIASSKPFATVLVPKRVLDGEVQHQQQQQVLRDYAQQEDSFRPIVPPIFTPYKSPNAASVVDTNSIVDNRRSSGKNQQQHHATSVTATPKLNNYGFVKPLTYKVEEYFQDEGKPSVVLDRGYSNEQDRSDRTSVISQKRDIINPHKRNHQLASSYYENAPRHDGPLKREEPLTYGVVEPVMGKFDVGSGPQQYREFYQATEWPAAVVKYEKFDSRSPPQQFGSDRLPGPVSETLPKEYFNGPHSSFSYPSPSTSIPSLIPQTESNSPEFVMGDLNPKDVLKSLLRDILKSKQQSETNPKTPPAMDEIIDSYLNTDQKNAEDSFDVQTGECPDVRCKVPKVFYTYLPK